MKAKVIIMMKRFLKGLMLTKFVWETKDLRVLKSEKLLMQDYSQNEQWTNNLVLVETSENSKTKSIPDIHSSSNYQKSIGPFLISVNTSFKQHLETYFRMKVWLRYVFQSRNQHLIRTQTLLWKHKFIANTVLTIM